MKKLITNPEYDLYERNGRALCTSLQVSDTFKRRHDHVLRDIEKLSGDLSPQFWGANFEKSVYVSRGKKYPQYLMTKDAFAIVVMGFTGKRAARFKEAYIRRFNEMEAFIKSLTTTKMEFPAFTNAVLIAHEEPKHYYFSNEINMIYRIVMGMDAKAIREQRGIPKGESVRPYLNEYEIRAVEELQRADIGLLVSVPDYSERKNILQGYLSRLMIKERLSA